MDYSSAGTCNSKSFAVISEPACYLVPLIFPSEQASHSLSVHKNGGVCSGVVRRGGVIARPFAQRSTSEAAHSNIHATQRITLAMISHQQRNKLLYQLDFLRRVLCRNRANQPCISLLYNGPLRRSSGILPRRLQRRARDPPGQGDELRTYCKADWNS